ncbi:MAG: isoprenylcysteine carboxylmethyltransferase family protein [Deltaproteobacteria bacterium]|nr:isoprenylcysteine carboxylmethyltransferase family protein [Deltaproteobacteria bacterium]
MSSMPAPINTIVKTILFPMFMGGILFSIAGDIRWMMGWLFFLLYVILTFLLAGIFSHKHEDLVKERKTAIKKAVWWDKIFFPLIAVFIPLAILVISALDHRFNWTRALPLYIQIIFYIISGIGCWITYSAMQANPFFSSVVRIQSDREQMVIKKGPYRFVRHPGYVGAIFYNISMPLALGSLWGLIPGIMEMILFVLRTKLEDVLLQKELTGYREYAEVVKYKLLPFVW